MYLDTVNDENNSKQDSRDMLSWESLIKDAESQIRGARTKIARLEESIRFFKQQRVSRKPFPIITEGVFVQKEDLLCRKS